MRGVHYYPSGALCWFETNQYGDPTGTVYFIKKIPDIKMLEIPRRQRSFKKLLQKKKASIKDSLIKPNVDMEVIETKKPRFQE